MTTDPASLRGPDRPHDAAAALPSCDDESRTWLVLLRADGAARTSAVARLHGLLLRAARFEVARRRAFTPHLRGEASADIALQAADDALMAVLARLGDYRGESRFTTWAYKFALFEASVAVRRRGWQGRELPIGDERWSTLAAPASPAHRHAEFIELIAALREAVATVLSPHQREVFTALALNEVPIDVLAERLGTTRGALYKSLHDARRKLRAELDRRGLTPAAFGGE